MGLWTKLAGIAVGGAGVVTANPALVLAGASIIGADVASEGAKKAGEQQAAGAEKAKTELDARYDQTRADQKATYDQSVQGFAPYQALGQGALPNLGAMVGLSPAQFAPSSAAPPQGQTLGQLGAPAPGATPAGQGVGVVAGAAPQQRAAMQTASSYQPPETKAGRSLGQMGSGLVLVKSPDGAEQRYLTRREADRAVAAGGMEVG